MKWAQKVAELIKAHPKGKPLTADGGELPDPTPMEPPVGYKAQPSMFEVMREMVRQEKLRDALEAEGLESPEEADDFEVDDDYEPHSPYEHDFDHVADPGELKRLRDAIDLRERELRGEVRSPSAPPLANTGTQGGGGAAAGGGGSQTSPPGAVRPPGETGV